MYNGCTICHHSDVQASPHLLSPWWQNMPQLLRQTDENEAVRAQVLTSTMISGMSGSEGGFLDSGLACSFSRNSRSYCFLPSGFAGDHWPVNVGTTKLPLRHRHAAPYTLELKVLGLDGSTGCTRVMWSVGTTSSVSKPTATLHIFSNFIWYTGLHRCSNTNTSTHPILSYYDELMLNVLRCQLTY